MAKSSANVLISESEHYFVGLDIGTTSVKAVAYNEKGKRIYLTEKNYPQFSPEVDWKEQDSTEIIEAAIEVLAELIRSIGSSPKAIGMSAAMHSMILLDEHQHALTPSVIWADLRAKSQAKKLKGTTLGNRIYQHTGTPIHPMSPLCKLLWFKEIQPEVFAKTRMILGIKGYLLQKLFGKNFIDYSLASATGLFDIHQLTWDEEALSLCNIQVDQLPELVPTTFELPSLSDDWLTRLGISSETRWVIGGSDGCLANLGTGKLAPGEAVLTVGTSGAIRINSPTPLYDPQERIFCYYTLPNHYVAGGATNNGGNVWSWFVETFGESKSHDYWFSQAENIPSGCEGLIFEPYLFGERAPLWDPEASASFKGWRSHHSKAHIARAVLEGIAANLHIILQVLGELHSPISRLIISGGLTRSSLFCKILSEKTGTTVHRSSDAQASARGAALIAQGRH